MLPERRLAGSKLPVKSCEDVISWPERACRWEQLSLSLGAVTIAQSVKTRHDYVTRVSCWFQVTSEEFVKTRLRYQSERVAVSS